MFRIWAACLNRGKSGVMLFRSGQPGLGVRDKLNLPGVRIQAVSIFCGQQTQQRETDISENCADNQSHGTLTAESNNGDLSFKSRSERQAALGAVVTVYSILKRPHSDLDRVRDPKLVLPELNIILCITYSFFRHITLA